MDFAAAAVGEMEEAREHQNFSFVPRTCVLRSGAFQQKNITLPCLMMHRQAVKHAPLQAAVPALKAEVEQQQVQKQAAATQHASSKASWGSWLILAGCAVMSAVSNAVEAVRNTVTSAVRVVTDAAVSVAQRVASAAASAAQAISNIIQQTMQTVDRLAEAAVEVVVLCFRTATAFVRRHWKLVVLATV